MFLPKPDGVWLSLSAEATFKARNIMNCEMWLMNLKYGVDNIRDISILGNRMYANTKRGNSKV
jgi:hypothetical protein